MEGSTTVNYGINIVPEKEINSVWNANAQYAVTIEHINTVLARNQFVCRGKAAPMTPPIAAVAAPYTRVSL